MQKGVANDAWNHRRIFCPIESEVLGMPLWSASIFLLWRLATVAECSARSFSPLRVIRRCNGQIISLNAVFLLLLRYTHSHDWLASTSQEFR